MIDIIYMVISNSLLVMNLVVWVDDDVIFVVVFINLIEISFDFFSMENNEENLIYIDGELVDL